MHHLNKFYEFKKDENRMRILDIFLLLLIKRK